MERFVYPVLFAVLLWWLSTGVVLRTVNNARSTYGVMAAATAGLIFGALGLYVSAQDQSLFAVYLAFVSSLLVWSWHEISFLTGYVTGPCTRPATVTDDGRAPLPEAIATVIYHEVAIAVTGLAIVALTWNAANLTGTWVFLVLWLSRLSAKVNIYLGVPNITEGFLPAHLKYLSTYFCRRSMNYFFPVSVTLTTCAALYAAANALEPANSTAAAAGATLVATLILLALLEHWFFVLPFDSAKLWSWAERGSEQLEHIDIHTATPHVATGGAS